MKIDTELSFSKFSFAKVDIFSVFFKISFSENGHIVLSILQSIGNCMEFWKSVFFRGGIYRKSAVFTCLFYRKSVYLQGENYRKSVNYAV